MGWFQIKPHFHLDFHPLIDPPLPPVDHPHDEHHNHILMDLMERWHLME